MTQWFRLPQMTIKNHSVPNPFFCSSGYPLGSTQAVTFRWFLAPNIKSSANQMNFGQIMPLLLLALLILAAAEIYYKSRQRSDSSMKAVDVTNFSPRDRMSGGNNPGPSIPNDPFLTAPSGQNDSRSEHLIDAQANHSTTIAEATSGQLSLAMISTDVITLYKKHMDFESAEDSIPLLFLF